MYGGIGVSAPSLHRESTDSLIHQRYTIINMYIDHEISVGKNMLSEVLFGLQKASIYERLSLIKYQLHNNYGHEISSDYL